MEETADIESNKKIWSVVMGNVVLDFPGTIFYDKQTTSHRHHRRCSGASEAIALLPRLILDAGTDTPEMTHLHTTATSVMMNAERDRPLSMAWPDTLQRYAIKRNCHSSDWLAHIT